MTTLLMALLAAGLAIIQAVFLSHLAPPVSAISLLTVGLCIAVVMRRDLEASLMALVGGSLLDLHGIFGFGAELAAAFAAYVVMRLLFARLLSNSNLLAIFLLAMSGTVARFVTLAGIDGLRVLSGQDPYLLIADPGLITGPLLAMLMTGLCTVAAVAVGRVAVRLARRVFLPSKLTLKL